jgi:DNA polymerase-3 subunit epsilon
MSLQETVAVLDFETTGLSPTQGDRATEVAIALVRDGKIVDRFQSLMNAGRRIPAAITALTGITNGMIEVAPPARQVMREAAAFVGNYPLVAHNAAFDRRFWQAELTQCGLLAPHQFACTLLAARRLFPQAADHKLGTLARLLSLPASGRAHRALADAEMASYLWIRMQEELRQTYNVPHTDFALFARIQSLSRSQIPAALQGMAHHR